jgi:hypothetical protein
MPELSGCPSCQGFNPPATRACLHCGHTLEAPTRRRSPGTFWALASAGIAALTLMACYGVPPCDDGTHHCQDPDPADGGLNDAGR